MAAFLSDTVKDNGVSYVETNCDKLVLTVGEPNNFSDANTNNGTGTGQKVVDVTVDGTDFTVGDGDTDGREVECAAQNGNSVAADGTADHWAWLDTGGTEILAYGPLASSKALTTSDTCDIPAHSATVRDATAV